MINRHLQTVILRLLNHYQSYSHQYFIEMIALQEETESIEEGKFAPRDDPSRLSVNEKVLFAL